MRLHPLGLAASGFIACFALLTGCSSSFAPGPETPVQTQFGDISGTVYGGQQPIVKATVYAYQTSTTAYGGASTQLATSPTDSGGYFSFPATTTCTSGTVVYLYSVGGQPTTNNTNTAAGLMALLGVCPSNGLLVNAVVKPPATSAQIYMNEVSTVAAAYALAGFAVNSANVSTDVQHIGALTTSDMLAQQGIQNAAANAAQMYTTVATANLPTGTSRAALATTPGGNGIVPQKLIDTIANILAACINSTNASSTNCTTLFNDDRSGGGQTGTIPTDTATAAIYLAQHPYSAYVSTLFNLVGSTANPFSPALSTAPASFVVELLFSGGGLSNTSILGTVVQNLAIDAGGNVWVANSNGSVISKFSPLGVSLAGTGYAATGCGISAATNPPVSVAIATTGYAWVGVSQKNAVCVLNSTGGYVAETSIYSKGDGPYGIAFDSAGNAWATNATGGETTQAGQLIELSGTSYAVLHTFTGNDMNYPTGIAIEPGGGDIWVGNFDYAGGGNGYDSVFTSTGASASFSGTGNGSAHNVYGAGMAIDSAGSIWTVNADTPGGVSKTAIGGTTTTYYAQNAAYGPEGIAIDGAGHVWYNSDSVGNAAPYDNTILEVNNSGTLLTSSAGFVPITDAAGGNEPISMAIDGSGDVWYTITDSGATGASGLRELIGAAIPVATPLAYGVANSKLGTRP
jgi:hypothetical protein